MLLESFIFISLWILFSQNINKSSRKPLIPTIWSDIAIFCVLLKDEKGSYFDIYMDGLQPERYYRVLVKSVIDGTTAVINKDNVFKVVRNG
mgnify:CR=1 FL=1